MKDELVDILTYNLKKTTDLFDKSYIEGQLTCKIDEGETYRYEHLFFSYDKEDDVLEINKFSEPGHFTGSCHELPLPAVVQENYEEITNKVQEAIEEYAQK